MCAETVRLCFSGVFGVSVAQTVTIDPVGPVTVVEGNVLDITCTDGVNMGLTILLHRNGEQLIEADTPPNDVNGTTRTYHLSVDKTEDRSTYNCVSALNNQRQSPVITLTVHCE